jgi:hypothetical protein
LPKGIKGKIGVTVSPMNPNRGWANIEAEDGGVFRSDDGGNKWRRVSEDRNLRQRAWYYTHIYADTKDPETVYVLNVQFNKSIDGGKTYETIRVPHGDNHDLWVAPAENNQPTAQFYHVITDNRFPYYVYGAQQDNSTVGIASGNNGFGITERDWYAVGGGESGYIAPHPVDANIVYAGNYGHGRRRRGFGVSLSMDVSDRDFAARSEHRLCCRQRALQIDERRANLGADQSGSHAQRQEQARPLRRGHHEGQHQRRILLHDFRRGGIAAAKRFDLGRLG